MLVKSVLHVSVRLEQGGAARVAKTLCDGMSGHGYQGQFAYGYGPKGGDSPEQMRADPVRTTGRKAAAVNYLSHSILGSEWLSLRADPGSRLGTAIDEADLVHLHAVHSYMGSATRLVNQIVASRRPVVWTLHDYWLMTGRCAQPAACRRWELGCGHCPTRDAYPPARLDRTAAGWGSRHRWVQALVPQVRFAAPSRAIAQDFLGVFPDAALTQIYNGVDEDFMSAAADTAGPIAGPAGDYYAVIADDLSNQHKVPPETVAALAAAGVRIKTAGRGSPFTEPGVENMGEIRSRLDLARFISGARATLFLSSVDVFSMALIESLVLGIPVLALPSANAIEALEPLGVCPFADEMALLQAVKKGDPWATYCQKDGQSLARAARNLYSTRTMTAAYASLYDEVLQCR